MDNGSDEESLDILRPTPRFDRLKFWAIMMNSGYSLKPVRQVRETRWKHFTSVRNMDKYRSTSKVYGRLSNYIPVRTQS